MPPSTALTLEPLTPQTIPRYIHLRITAFRPTIGKLVFEPFGPHPDTIEAMHSIIASYLTNHYPVYCVRDTGIDEVIAAAKWRLVAGGDAGVEDREGKVEWGKDGRTKGKRWLRDLTDEEVKEELRTPPKWKESRQDIWDALYANFGVVTRKIMEKRPYWTLDLIMTHPDHERRGAASMLVEWGCQRADEMGIECFLTASEKGRMVYERCGFEVVDKGRFDTKEAVGVDVGYVYDYVAMIRKPRAL